MANINTYRVQTVEKREFEIFSRPRWVVVGENGSWLVIYDRAYPHGHMQLLVSKKCSVVLTLRWGWSQGAQRLS